MFMLWLPNFHIMEFYKGILGKRLCNGHFPFISFVKLSLYNTTHTIHRSRSRITGMGVHMYKDVRFALSILSHFFRYPMKMK